jgi:hypothetical protein
MEPLSEALRLLQRQAELETRMRNPGGIRVHEERELFQVRARLEKYPAAVGAWASWRGTKGDTGPFAHRHDDR